MSYLKILAHRSTVFWILPLHPTCTDPPSHPLPRDSAAPLSAPYCPPSFRSWIACPNKLPSCRPPPPVLQLLSCCPRHAPQVPVVPSSPVPRACFYRLVPCSIFTLSLPSTSLAPLSTPVGSLFLVTSFLCQFSNYPPLVINDFIFCLT